MTSLLRVPEVAAGATEAVLSEWLVEENSPFVAGQPIVVIETDKAVVEVPADCDAVLLRHLVSRGTSVEVGAPIALVGDASEKDSDLDESLAGLGVSLPQGAGASPTDRLVTESVRVPPAPATAGAPPAVSGTAAAHGTGRVFISPLARRILREAGLTTGGITGTGPGGRIVRRDVEKAVERARRESAGTAPQPRSAPAPVTSPAPVIAPRPSGLDGRGYREVPHSRVRRAIAARLTASKQSIPHFYVKRTARIDALLDLRRRLNEVSQQKISVNDLLLRAVAMTHVAVPEANSIWTEDAVRVFDSVDVAVAIASQRGLVTPVLRDVQKTTPSAIARQTREFVRLADEGRLAQRDLEGGSITVTNLGMYGVEEFSAIINPPHSAILAVGAGIPAPVVVDGAVEVATVLSLVLSVDHRVIDGALAARWVDMLVTIIQEPLRLLA